MTKQEDNPIKVAVEGNIGVLTMDRPPANAYDLGVQQTFLRAIQEVDDDERVRAVLLRSASPKFFCAGADIKAFAANDTETNQQMAEAARQTVAAIEASDKLFVAYIAGHALGGGLEIALACDLRLASPGNYQLGLPEIKLGLMPGNGGVVRLARVIGRAAAMELLVTGDSVTPDRAAELGIVHRLLAGEDAQTLAAQAMAFVSDLAAGPTRAITATKKCLQGSEVLPQAEALVLEAALAAPLFATQDAREGFQAFTEKRAPVYTGR